MPAAQQEMLINAVTENPDFFFCAANAEGRRRAHGYVKSYLGRTRLRSRYFLFRFRFEVSGIKETE